jgi:hypothetical protein
VGLPTTVEDHAGVRERAFVTAVEAEQREDPPEDPVGYVGATMDASSGIDVSARRRRVVPGVNRC